MSLACDWYPVFLREMLLFKHKLLRVGYLFSAMVTPIIYLLTFGLGLGRHVTAAEDPHKGRFGAVAFHTMVAHFNL